MSKTIEAILDKKIKELIQQKNKQELKQLLVTESNPQKKLMSDGFNSSRKLVG